MTHALWVILGLTVYNAVVATVILVRITNMEVSLRYLWDKAARQTAILEMWYLAQKKADAPDASNGPVE
jgi:hypothetical protein